MTKTFGKSFFRRSQRAFPTALSLLALAGGSLHAQTKVIALSPTALAFPVTVTGKPSAPQTITVTSTGNTAVTFTGFTVAGADAADFRITANTCGATLPSTSSCQVSVTFTPAATAARTATLSVADDATGSPQTASLSGAGSNIVFTLRPAAITFPVVNVGAASTPSQVTVTNIGVVAATISSITVGGGDPADFTIGTKTCGATLAAGTSCTVNISFTPKANGIRTANLLFTDTASGSPQSVALNGTAQGTNQTLVFSPTMLAFNPTNVGSLVTGTVSVVNYGNASTTITGTTVTGPNATDFAVVNSCAPLAPAASCTITVAFKPLAAGLRTAIVLVQDNALGSPQSLPLSGSGVAGAPLLTFSPLEISFVPQNIGATSTVNLTVTNNGTANALFSSYAISGKNATDFSITSNSCPAGSGTLAPAQACTLGITFTPAASGVRIASLSITDNAIGSPQVISLSGSGQALTKLLSFNTGTLAFGAESIGATTGLNTVYAKSVGAGTVTLSNVTLAGANAADFTINDSNCIAGTTLPPNSQCYVDVKFTPSAAGTRSATLTFTDDAKGSPQTVTLVGVGEATTEQLSFNYVNLDLGILDIGSASAQSAVTVSNYGDAPVTFASITVAGLNAADFSVTIDNCLSASPLQPGSSCAVYVIFIPSAGGVRSAQLKFTDNATGSPQIVGLSGTGQAVTETVSFQNPSYVFPATIVGVTAPQIYDYFYNTGDAPIIISSIAVTGGNATDFKISNNQCPIGGAGVAGGSNCYVYVTFTPSATGIRTSTLQFTDSATGSPQTVPLVGLGAPVVSPLSFNPTDVSFGDQNVGTTSTAVNIGITNPGAAAVSETIALAGANASDFNILTNNCPASLGAGLSCNLTVTFKPAGLGLRDATVKVTANSTVLNVGLSGVGTTGAKIITTAQNAVAFGPVNVASTGNQMNVTVENTGTETVTFSGFSLAGANASDFTISSNQCGSTLSVGATCNIYLTFTPSAAGVRTATLQISDDAVGSPQGVPLDGIGQTVAKALEIPQVVAFPALNVGSTVSQYVYVYDIGTASVTLSSVTIAGANASDFSVAQTNCTGGGSVVNPGGYCYFYVSFTPSAAGTRTASLQLADDAVGSPQSIPLTGFGQTPVKTLILPQAVVIPITNVGLINSNTYFYVTNSGNATVTVTSQTITGANASDFSISSTTCTGQIAAGSNCYTYITFAPSAPGLRTATYQIADDATGSPQSVALSGVGQASTKSLSFPPAITFPVTSLGATSQTGYYYVYNIGTATVTLSGIAVTGTNAAEFAIAGGSCVAGTTIAPGSYCSIYLNFTPTLIGPQTAVLQLTDDAAASPQSIALNGVGQGITDTASITPGTLNFGTVSIGSTSGQVLTYLYNTGTAPITLTGTAIAGANATDFAITQTNCTAGTQLNVGGNCYIYVTFTPSAAGLRSGTLQVTDNAVGGTQSAILTGFGQ